MSHRSTYGLSLISDDNWRHFALLKKEKKERFSLNSSLCNTGTETIIGWGFFFTRIAILKTVFCVKSPQKLVFKSKGGGMRVCRNPQMDKCQERTCQALSRLGEARLFRIAAFRISEASPQRCSQMQICTSSFD